MHRYREWRKGFEIVMQLNDLTKSELSMLLFSQLRGRPKQLIDIVEPGKFIDGTNSSVFLKVSMEGPKPTAAGEIILVDTSWQLWGLDVEIEGRFDD